MEDQLERGKTPDYMMGNKKKKTWQKEMSKFLSFFCFV